jgi:hypothetical protein
VAEPRNLLLVTKELRQYQLVDDESGLLPEEVGKLGAGP